MEINYRYQKLREASKLLKNEYLYYVLRDIFHDDDYFSYVERLEGDLLVYFDHEGRKIYLDLSDVDPVFTICIDNVYMEQTKIYLTKGMEKKDNIFVDCTIIDKRTSGIVVREIDKVYSACEGNSVYREVINQVERDYVYNDNTLKGVLESFWGKNILYIVSKLDNVGIVPGLQSVLKIYKFENTYGGDEVCVEVDGVDLSCWYNSLDGGNLVSRVSDLFRGKITKVNSRDIYLIHLKKLEMDTFGLRKLKGIDAVERDLVGFSLLERSHKDEEYVQEFLMSQFGVVCKNLDSRRWNCLF